MVTAVYELLMIYKLNMIFQDHLFFLPAVKVSHVGIWCPMGAISAPHTLHEVLASIGPTHGMVSKLYKFISGPLKPLPVEAIWSRDLFDVTNKEICWNTVWENLFGTSKNPNHYKFVHRMYLTPRRRHSIKITTSPNSDVHLIPWGHLCMFIGNALIWLDSGRKYLSL